MNLCTIHKLSVAARVQSPSSNSYSHNEPWLPSTKLGRHFHATYGRQLSFFFGLNKTWTTQDVSCLPWKDSSLSSGKKHFPHQWFVSSWLVNNSITKAFDFDQIEADRAEKQPRYIRPRLYMAFVSPACAAWWRNWAADSSSFLMPSPKAKVSPIKSHHMSHHITPTSHLRPHLGMQFPIAPYLTVPSARQVTIQQHNTQGISSCTVPIQGCTPKALGCLRKVLWPPQA